MSIRYTRKLKPPTGYKGGKRTRVLEGSDKNLVLKKSRGSAVTKGSSRRQEYLSVFLGS